MSPISQVSVVLPSLDPDKKLLGVIEGLIQAGFDDIILVNDGSREENLPFFQAAAAHPQVQLLHHPHNRGKGAALKTAFDWFLKNRPHQLGVVTVDGDGQHHPEDTAACAQRLLQSSAIVLGVRDFSLPQVPWRSRWGNRITSLVFRLFVGMKLSDTQTGLRAIPTALLPAVTAISGDRFEYETNMLLEMKSQGLPFLEQKIRTVYIEENQSSHFRAVRDSWRIYKLILAHFFRYTLSSLGCFLVDEGLFLLLGWLLAPVLSGFALTAVPTAAARLFSSLLNFFVNKRLVFQKNGELLKDISRYYLLALPIALAQMGLSYGTFRLLGIGPAQTVLRGVIYGIVMALLFLVSFMVQKNWVFRRTPKGENQ